MKRSKDKAFDERLYVCNFLNCKNKKMEKATVTIVKNIRGRYVVTKWLDYEYGRYAARQEFRDKDAAAEYAWSLLGERT